MRGPFIHKNRSPYFLNHRNPVKKHLLLLICLIINRFVFRITNFDQHIHSPKKNINKAFPIGPPPPLQTPIIYYTPHHKLLSYPNHNYHSSNYFQTLKQQPNTCNFTTSSNEKSRNYPRLAGLEEFYGRVRCNVMWK